MTDATLSKVPLHTKLHDLPIPPPNALPDIKDADILSIYQSLIRSLIYLAICTRPDIAYTVMVLGVFSSKPTRAHLLAAKGVLHYLAGTLDFAMVYGGDLGSDPLCITSMPSNNCVLTNADWATDEADRKSISGYAFFIFGGLVSWSRRSLLFLQQNPNIWHWHM